LLAELGDMGLGALQVVRFEDRPAPGLQRILHKVAVNG
jgi:hypothetical protein